MDAIQRTRIEKREQLRELEAAIMSGVPEADAVRQHVEKHKLTPERGRGDLCQLRKRWARKDADLGKSLARLEHLYRRAMQHGDWLAALEAEKARCELSGLYPTAAVATKQR